MATLSIQKCSWGLCCQWQKVYKLRIYNTIYALTWSKRSHGIVENTKNNNQQSRIVYRISAILLVTTEIVCLPLKIQCRFRRLPPRLPNHMIRSFACRNYELLYTDSRRIMSITSLRRYNHNEDRKSCICDGKCIEKGAGKLGVNAPEYQGRVWAFAC